MDMMLPENIETNAVLDGNEEAILKVSMMLSIEVKSITALENIECAHADSI